MVNWIEAAALALIQGFSEFLPVSSSAHLVLPSQLLGWNDQGLFFDVVVHFGTLLAVLFYFRRDLISLLPTAFSSKGVPNWQGELWMIVLATMPVILAGYLAAGLISQEFRGLAVIATTTLVFGMLLGVSVIRSERISTISAPISWRAALFIGFAQIFALIPGVSRSGITITAGLWLGYGPRVATRFSFLLSIPVILGAISFMLVEALGGIESPPADWSILTFALTAAAVSAYFTIAFFFRLIDRIGLMPFVWYRLALGIVLFGIFFIQ
jgi:undecaprenyl-diphosphatase